MASVSRFVRSAFVVFCLSLSLFEEEEEQDEGRRKNTMRPPLVVCFSTSLSHSKRYLSPGCGTQPIQHEEEEEEMKRDQKR